MYKRIIYSFLFILGLMIAIPVSSGLAIENPVDSDIQTLVDRWVAMWNSYDLTAVDTLFLQDSRVSYFSSEKKGLIRGIDAIRAHHQGFGFVEGGKIQGNKLWIEEVQVSEFGTAAVVAGIWYFHRVPDDAESVQKGPFTFVCVLEGKEWRLAHLNFSHYE